MTLWNIQRNARKYQASAKRTLNSSARRAGTRGYTIQTKMAPSALYSSRYTARPERVRPANPLRTEAAP
jgi:hypothetical protein